MLSVQVSGLSSSQASAGHDRAAQVADDIAVAMLRTGNGIKSLPAVAAAIIAAEPALPGTGAASAAPSSGPPVRTYIPTPSKSELVYRPGTLYLEYGPELVARHIHWLYWHHADAQATANLIGSTLDASPSATSRCTSTTPSICA